MLLFLFFIFKLKTTFSPSRFFSSFWNISSSSIFRLAGLDLRPAPSFPLRYELLRLWAPPRPSSISIIHQANPHWSPPEHTFTGGFRLLWNTPKLLSTPASSWEASVIYCCLFTGVLRIMCGAKLKPRTTRSGIFIQDGGCDCFQRPEVEMEAKTSRTERWRTVDQPAQSCRGNFILHVYSILQIIDTLISLCLKIYESSGQCLPWEEWNLIKKLNEWWEMKEGVWTDHSLSTDHNGIIHVWLFTS